MTTKLQIDQIIPGGIRGDDYIHRGRNDNTCSRCRLEVPEDHVPLLLWTNDGDDLMIYCETCLGIERQDSDQCDCDWDPARDGTHKEYHG